MTATTISMTLPSGKVAAITVTAEKGWDGGVIAVTSAVIDGTATTRGYGRPAGLPAWAVSAIGKLPLTAEADAQVAAAVAAINAEYALQRAAAAAHMAELAEVTRGTRRIERAMAY